MCEEDRRVITSLKYSSYLVKPTIVNGEPVANDRVPYLVSIKEPMIRITVNEYKWANLCGGSIIAPQKVLTAAHCFETSNFFYARYPHILRIVAGSNNTFIVHSGVTDTTSEVQIRKIARVVLNRDFLFPSNDIALVFVNVPFNFSNTVDYILPARKNADYPSSCVSAGFGRIGHNLRDPDSNVLLIARIRVLSRWKCSTLWQMNMNTFLCTDSQLTDVARGDSGGPLACYDTTDPEEIPGKELLVGIVSGKNFDRTTLFTRVSAYSDWIDKDVACQVVPTLFTIILLVLIYLLFYYTD